MIINTDNKIDIQSCNIDIYRVYIYLIFTNQTPVIFLVRIDQSSNTIPLKSLLNVTLAYENYTFRHGIWKLTNAYGEKHQVFVSLNKTNSC